MSLVNKLTKNLRWLRWSTICAILFYMFFIGLILHSTTYKLQHTLKSRRQQQPLSQQQQQSQLHIHTILREHVREQQQQHQQQQQQKQKQFSAATGNNVLQAPPELPETSLATSNGQKVYHADYNNNNNNNNNKKNNKKHKKHHSSSRQKLDIGYDAAPLPPQPPPQPLKAVIGNELRDDGSAEKGVKTVAVSRVKSREPETVILAASSVNEKQILEKAFRRADTNEDSLLTIQELALYINKQIIDHIEEAIQLNPREFRQVDISPADGLITWDEYHRFFLREHGMTEADIDEHDEIKHTALNRKAREDMMRDKARWSEAARTDLFSLTIDEYLSFRHPESSISNLLELVDDLLRQFDQDGDDQLTIEEFSDVTMNDDDDLIRKSLISRTVVERRAEFKRIIDKNHDDRADREELLNYVNPKTPRYALQEAATLFSLCDENKDGKLTLDEMAANAEIFLSSKMIDTANSFHTEF